MEHTRPEGTESGKKNLLKFKKKKIPFSSYRVSVVHPGTKAGPAQARACLPARNAMLANTASREPHIVPADPVAASCPWHCVGTPHAGGAGEDPWLRSGSSRRGSSHVVLTSWMLLAGPEAWGL